VLLALDVSAKTFQRIYLNYAWAFGYNLLMVPLAAGALYPPLRFQLPPWVRMLPGTLAGCCMVLFLTAATPSLHMNSIYEPVLVTSTHWTCGTCRWLEVPWR